ncbi:hypothetical protein Desal_1655 [Maridesulfovibrio salexigens DSM 2638]|uniref:DUF4435 domain-containing protein n=1 Tax=Maridesulfovibrio salexigens (strain ATCC 14822 / DSM 2638 / NCIMB 8403 / VKM B-1763) TaxID=526222 RepID=C6BT13_MARSD|nr:hypothetical protein Desal_1655 [Maridesulfovibrio salexigens DSM 2638]
MSFVRSDVARVAKSIFFSKENGIDIFVEDTAVGFKKLYLILFKRVFEGIYNIENIYPLGSRSAVVNRCQIDQRRDNPRPRLYVVDGDLNLLHGNWDVPWDGLYQLPRYCIENFLLDEQAILEILDEEDPEQTLEDLRIQFDFVNWISANKELMVNLFIEYAVSIVLTPEEKTISLGVNELKSDSSGIVDHVKTIERINFIKQRTIEKVGEDSYSIVKEEIASIVGDENIMLVKYASAKDYLFPLLKIYLRNKKCEIKHTQCSLRLRIAKKCNLDCLMDCIDSVNVN